MTRHRSRKKWNRDIPDSILLCHSRDFDGIPTAPSLHPDIRLIEQFVVGVPEARAIVEAWHCPWQELIRNEVRR